MTHDDAKRVAEGFVQMKNPDGSESTIGFLGRAYLSLLAENERLKAALRECEAHLYKRIDPAEMDSNEDERRAMGVCIDARRALAPSGEKEKEDG